MNDSKIYQSFKTIIAQSLMKTLLNFFFTLIYTIKKKEKKETLYSDIIIRNFLIEARFCPTNWA